MRLAWILWSVMTRQSERAGKWLEGTFWVPQCIIKKGLGWVKIHFHSHKTISTIHILLIYRKDNMDSGSLRVMRLPNPAGWTDWSETLGVGGGSLGGQNLVLTRLDLTTFLYYEISKNRIYGRIFKIQISGGPWGHSKQLLLLGLSDPSNFI